MREVGVGVLVVLLILEEKLSVFPVECDIGRGLVKLTVRVVKPFSYNKGNESKHPTQATALVTPHLQEGWLSP